MFKLLRKLEHYVLIKYLLLRTIQSAIERQCLWVSNCKWVDNESNMKDINYTLHEMNIEYYLFEMDSVSYKLTIKLIIRIFFKIRITVMLFNSIVKWNNISTHKVYLNVIALS